MGVAGVMSGQVIHMMREIGLERWRKKMRIGNKGDLCHRVLNENTHEGT